MKENNFFLQLVKAYLLKTIRLQVLVHCFQFGMLFLYFYENKKGSCHRQTLLGLIFCHFMIITNKIRNNKGSKNEPLCELFSI